MANTKIKQIFFDCDNTLVNSEEIAFEACAGLVNSVLEDNDVPKRYTGEELLVEFMGLSFKKMLPVLQQRFNFTLTAEETAEYSRKEEEAVILALKGKVQACPGVHEVLERLKAEDEFGLAVVSSSALRRIRASLSFAELDKYFHPDHIYSASTSLPIPAPKPSPIAYLFAMEKLGLQPEECVAIEDSKSGAGSAVGAGIATISYLGCYRGERKQAQVAELLTAVGCKATMYNWAQFESCFTQIRNSTGHWA